jgi:hypothetical protein
LWRRAQARHAGRVPLAVFRGIAAAIFVAGIVGMIVGSVADNNNGVVVTFGIVTAFAAVVLMSVAFTTRVLTEELRPPVPEAPPAFDDAAAEAVEQRVRALVDAGADKADVRALVGEAVRLGRSAPEPRPVG